MGKSDLSLKLLISENPMDKPERICCGSERMHIAKQAYDAKHEKYHSLRKTQIWEKDQHRGLSGNTLPDPECQTNHEQDQGGNAERPAFQKTHQCLRRPSYPENLWITWLSYQRFAPMQRNEREKYTKNAVRNEIRFIYHSILSRGPFSGSSLSFSGFQVLSSR